MDTIAVLDFGGQYSHLIARRIRENGVYSVVMEPDTPIEKIKAISGLKGVILSGGAASVYDGNSPKCDPGIMDIGIPMLGICYGHQLLAHIGGGFIEQGNSGEYGTTEISINSDSELLAGLGGIETVWMNHKDTVSILPDGWMKTSSSVNSKITSYENSSKKIYGVQFHPEVSHTKKGNLIFENFIYNICKAEKQWSVGNLINSLVKETIGKIVDKKAVLALSGGVDSSTAAVIVSKAIGKKLICVYVDTGLMRHEETQMIEKAFSSYDLDLRIVDARNRFFTALGGVTDPEQKRKVIGKLFVEIFTEIAKQEKAEVLCQGTIYSDRIESGITKHSSNIKSHHNVGGLPENMELQLYEPLKDLYKDEVRRLAAELGISRDITGRHVFPGPGMAIRIIGEVTPERAEIARKANFIVEQEMKNAGLYDKVWMAFAVLLPIKTVGIQGDSRSYKYSVAVRIVESTDAMTANFSKIPYEILGKISTRITNEIPEVNRVVYDISNKPPATMEWE